MALDIRIPIGLLFVILGGLLIAYGLVAHDPAMYRRSLGYNINLLWGLVMLVFGILMFVFGRRKSGAPPSELSERVADGK